MSITKHNRFRTLFLFTNFSCSDPQNPSNSRFNFQIKRNVLFLCPSELIIAHGLFKVDRTLPSLLPPQITVSEQYILSLP
mmetsp:Transcript_78645/g.154374  ORF Transcript_78645/g.154374 Transcript_78645/m.154374 type:complete len:80 (-) Transcript_78645:1810-2049(-)